MSKQTKMVAIRPPPMGIDELPDRAGAPPAPSLSRDQAAEAAAQQRYRDALADGLSDAEARNEGWPVPDPNVVQSFGDDATQDGPDGPVYVFAMWRDGPHGHRRVRAHLPLEVVLAGAVCEPSPADMRSRVVGAIEGELTSESINRNVPWER